MSSPPDEVSKTLIGDGIALGSAFLGGIIGNLAASALVGGAAWLARPLLDKVPDLAQLMSQGGVGKNHDLLRAFRRAESAAMLELIDSCIFEHADINREAGRLRTYFATRVRQRNDPDLQLLCTLRCAYRDLWRRLRDMPTDELARLEGGALQDVPALVAAGVECFASDDTDALRARVVSAQLARLDVALQSPARFVGLSTHALHALCPAGVPAVLRARMERHPGGWWDFLRLAFREELKEPANMRARTAWQMDVHSQLTSVLGAASLQSPPGDQLLEAECSELRQLNDDFNGFAEAVLAQLQRIERGVERIEHQVETGLRDLHGAVADLRHAAGPVALASAPAARFQLPALAEHFVGRQTWVVHTAQTLRLAHASGDRDRLVQVIEGAGGLGKTAVAVAVAYALRDCFADFQFVLRLHTHSGQPLASTDARDNLLRHLYPGIELPKEEAGRWHLYRTQFQGDDGLARNGLLLIDDCPDDEALQQLLPSVPVPVLVTSRRSLATGAVQVIQPLETAPAAELVCAIYGHLVADGRADELARLCGGFPIALRAAAGFLRRSRRQGSAITAYLAALTADPLAAVAVKDPAANTERVLEYSLRDLSPPELQALCDLSILSASFDRSMALTVAKCPEHFLDAFVELHLLEVDVAADTLGWHDLLRALVARRHMPDARQQAWVRLCQAAISTVEDACRARIEGAATAAAASAALARESQHVWAAMQHLLLPTHDSRLMQRLLAVSHPRELLNHLGWRELSDWYLAAQRQAVATGDQETLANAHLGAGVLAFFRGDLPVAQQELQSGLTLHRSSDRLQGQAIVLDALAEVNLARGELTVAAGQYEESLQLHKLTFNMNGQAAAYRGLGEVKTMCSEYTPALEHYETALRLFREVGNLTGQAAALKGMGFLQPHLADGHFSTALDIYRSTGNVTGQANVLQALGRESLIKDDLATARVRFKAALDIYRQTGNLFGEGNTLKSMGDMAMLQGNFEEANACFEQALSKHRRTGSVIGEATVLLGLGELLRRQDDATAARQHFEQALSICMHTGSTAARASAHLGIGEVARMQYDEDSARQHLQQARDILQRLNNPDLVRYVDAQLKLL